MNTQAMEVLEQDDRVASRRAKLLLAVSEHGERQYGVRFASNFFSGGGNVDFSLLYLLPRLSVEMVGPLGAGISTAKVDKEFYAQQEKLGQEGFRAAKLTLEQNHYDTDGMESIMRPRVSSKVSDIIEEGSKGGFDAIVLGKRGRSWLDNVFEGTEDVGKDMLNTWCSRPFWLCPDVCAHCRNVLLCVNGSAQRHQITTHVGSMLLLAPRHSVTILNVERENGQKDTDYDYHVVLDECRDRLIALGVGEERIFTKHLLHSNVPGAILGEAELNNYAAVALGHGMQGRNEVGRSLFGSVSEVLYRKLRRAALWIQS